jgi:peptidoglycan/LPS O-acetylase OafA/YrhL
MKQQSYQGHENNFSSLRILFATLVILSHSFELIDGNRSREILTRIFGTISFGDLAVDGFFIVSGYLITKSYLSTSNKSYFLSRVLRIYPGFIVSFVLSIIACQCFLSGRSVLSSEEMRQNIENILFLLQPVVPGAYPGSNYPLPNGAMWTISYEFHCYLMVMLLGFLGIFRRKGALAALTAVVVFAYLLHPDRYTPYIADHAAVAVHHSGGLGSRLLRRMRELVLQSSVDDIRFLAIFLVGSCFFIFRQVIPFRRDFAAIAAVALIGCLFSQHLAEPGLAIFGGYIIFWFALGIEALSISKIFNKTDLSYGIYLYAWPVQKILIALCRGIGPYELFVFTSLICVVLAYLSWRLVEKPCLDLKSLYRRRRMQVAATAKNA